MNFDKNIIKDKISEFDFTKNNIEASDILICENMILSDNGFETRPAVSPFKTAPIFKLSGYSEYADFQLTDFFVTVDKKTAQLSVIIESDNDSYIYYRILAIFSDGSSRSLGYIPFNRASADTFASPYSYVIYSGKQTVGGGIYFLTRIGYDDVSDEFRIYEISESLDSWILLSEAQYYIPTVLSHGRGDKASLAIASSDINISKPQKLQSTNLLTGNFKCYYTSDGYSNSFTLPMSESDPDYITCSVATDVGTVITWKMRSESSYSVDANIGGIAINATYRSDLNQVVFTKADGTAYAPSYYGLENNICFTVANSKNSALRVSSMTKACNITGYSETGSADVTVFSGSYGNSNEILWIDPEYPLYFPSNCSRTLSSSKGGNESMVALNEKAIFFKNRSIISYKVTAARSYSIENIVRGVENSEKVSYPTLVSEKRISLSKGINMSSVTRSGNEIWFCDNDGNIYRTDSSLSFKSFASKITVDPETALICNGYYIAVKDDTCSVFDISQSDQPVVLSWKLPIKIITSSDFIADTVFFANDKNGSLYIYRLDGETDRYFTDEAETVTENISSSLSLRLFKGMEKKRLYHISVKTELSENSLMEIFDEDKKIGHHIITDGKTLNKRPTHFENLTVKFSFGNNATLKEINVRYGDLSKTRR